MRFEEIFDEYKIERYKSMIDEQKSEIEKREVMIDSLTDSLVKAVRSIYPLYSDNMLHDACWGQTKSDDVPKEKQQVFKFVKNDFLERLFEDKEERKHVKFQRMSTYGYDRCAYGFYFKYHGISFEVKIPNIKNINADNLIDTAYGKYQLKYEERSSVWKRITSSYELDDIAKAIQKFVKGE